MDFAAKIKAFEEKALLAANASVCKEVETLFTEVVKLSPNSPSRKGDYAKGLVKNSWYTSMGAMDLTVGMSPALDGMASLTRIKSMIANKPFFKKDGVVFFTNSVKYINYVENIGWPKDFLENKTGWKWTGRAVPYKMVATSVTKWRNIYV